MLKSTCFVTGLLLIAVSIVVPPAQAEVYTSSYEALTATIEVDEGAEPGTDFDVLLSGSTDGGSGFSVSAFSVYRDADWSYTAGHMVSIASGEFLFGDGFMWGGEFNLAFTDNLPEGTYDYTFVFGYRSGGHGWYDVAVDATVIVAPALVVCDERWLPPIKNGVQVGRTLPLKFSFHDCEDGTLYVDEDVTLEIVDEDGQIAEVLVFTGNPGTGIDENGSFYHANWDTSGFEPGAWTIRVVLAGNVILDRDVLLKK